MKFKQSALSGAAIIALAGILTSMPALAQTSSQDNGMYGSQTNPPQTSSPAEKQQTRALNLQSVGGTNVTPATLNGETPAPPTPAPSTGGPQSSADAPIPRIAQDSPPQQQYQQQQQQYQQQQQDYQDKQSQYDEQKRGYDRNTRQYDQARWDYTDYPAVYAYSYDDNPRLQRLTLIDEPARRLANVPVEGPSGIWVGKIKDVESGADGRPSRIEIALNHRVSVWVGADALRFDSADRVVFTDKTRDQLWDMPSDTVETGGPY